MLSRSARSAIVQAIRHWTRSPAFTSLTVLTLALGIGSATTLYAVLHRVLVDPIPLPQAGQLVMLRSTVTGMGWSRIGVSEPLYRDLAGELTVMTDVAAYEPIEVNVSGTAEPTLAKGIRASAELFGVLRAPVQLGRAFTADETRPGGPAVAVITEAFWRTQLGGTRDVLARTLRIDGAPHAILGVLSDAAVLPDAKPAIIVPLRLPVDIRANRVRRGTHNLSVVARVNDNTTIQRADADIERFNRWLIGTQGDFYLPRFGFRVELVPMRDEIVAGARESPLLLGAATGLVLLIATANVSNLLMSRNERRRRELAVRVAMGASGARLVRMLTLESVVLILAAWLGGLTIAVGLTEFLMRVFADAIPRAEAISLEWPVLLVSLGTSALSALLVTVLPAIHTLGLSPASVLKEEGRSTTSAGSHLRTGVVILEMALAFTLVAGAGLMLRSLDRIGRVDPGFRTPGVVVAQVVLPESRYASAVEAEQFYRAVVARLVELPGVVAAGAVDALPLRDEVAFAAYRPGTTFQGTSPADVAPSALRHVVTQGYLEAIGVPLLAGRAFATSDDSGAAPVAVVNRSFAARHWPSGTAVGRPITLFGDPTRTVIGVVGDARVRELTTGPEPEVYLPAAQLSIPRRTMHVVVRGIGGTGVLADVMRRAVADVDPGLSLGDVTSLAEVVDGSASRPRLLATLMTGFAALALALGAVGVFSVLAYSLELRAREIAIRVALGASPGDVRRLVIRSTAGVVAMGLFLGIGGAIVLARLARATLFEIQPLDAVSFAGAATTVLLAVALAILLPMLRAAGRSALAALRQS